MVVVMASLLPVGLKLCDVYGPKITGIYTLVTCARTGATAQSPLGLDPSLKITTLKVEERN